jgi:hypothetical protein
MIILLAIIGWIGIVAASIWFLYGAIFWLKNGSWPMWSVFELTCRDKGIWDCGLQTGWHGLESIVHPMPGPLALFLLGLLLTLLAGIVLIVTND